MSDFNIKHTLAERVRTRLRSCTCSMLVCKLPECLCYVRGLGADDNYYLHLRLFAIQQVSTAIHLCWVRDALMTTKARQGLTDVPLDARNALSSLHDAAQVATSEQCDLRRTYRGTSKAIPSGEPILFDLTVYFHSNCSQDTVLTHPRLLELNDGYIAIQNRVTQ